MTIPGYAVITSAQVSELEWLACQFPNLCNYVKLHMHFYNVSRVVRYACMSKCDK